MDVAIVSTVVYEIPYCERRCRMPLDVVGASRGPTLESEARAVVGQCVLAMACSGDSFVRSIRYRESAGAFPWADSLGK